MFLLILIVSLVIAFSQADPYQSGQYLKLDRNIVYFAKLKQEVNQHSCVLSPYTMEGPFFLGDDLERSDVTDDQRGVPLHLTIRIIDARTCLPLSEFYVHIWSANATGFYSGVAGKSEGSQPGPQKAPRGFGSLDPIESLPGMGGIVEHNNDEEPKIGRPTAINDDRSLRGYQITDEDGVVFFQTIIPGWYAGRTQHLHVEVYRSAKVEKVTFVGQVFFPEEIIPRIRGTPPYNENSNPIVSHSEDNIYVTRHGKSTLLKLTRKDNGYAGEITFGINPSIEIPTDDIQATKDLP